MRVKYIGKHDTPAIDKGKIYDVYDVISIEKCWYRIMTELDEDYLFPPEEFQVIEEENSISIGIDFSFLREANNSSCALII